MEDAGLDCATLVGLAVLGAVALVPVMCRRISRGLRGPLRRLRGRAQRTAGRLRDAGALVLARRASAGLLGAGSTLLAVAAPARAVAPDPGLVHAASARPTPTLRTPVPAAARPEVVVVRRGDTLWALARRHLPAGASDAQIARAWPLWYAANRAVIGPDPGLLLPGQRLRVPGARPTGTSSTPHHRSPAHATGHATAPPATSFDPDRR